MINHETTPTDAPATFAADVDVTYRASADIVRRSCMNHSQTVLRGVGVNYSQAVLSSCDMASRRSAR